MEEEFQNKFPKTSGLILAIFTILNCLGDKAGAPKSDQPLKFCGMIMKLDTFTKAESKFTVNQKDYIVKIQMI